MTGSPVYTTDHRRTVTGGEPGPYGERRDGSSCDTDTDSMVAFLQANPEQGATWAAVQGPGDRDPELRRRAHRGRAALGHRGLINHGFRAGRATPFPVVPQSGTAVPSTSSGCPGYGGASPYRT